jgi:hypothetical protein
MGLGWAGFRRGFEVWGGWGRKFCWQGGKSDRKFRKYEIYVEIHRSLNVFEGHPLMIRVNPFVDSEQSRGLQGQGTVDEALGAYGCLAWH